MEIFPGISVDPDVRFGKPCIKGTRMDVATVVGLFAPAKRLRRSPANTSSLLSKSVRHSPTRPTLLHTCRRLFARRRESFPRREFPAGP